MEHEGVFRITMFIFVFFVVAIWEKIKPRRCANPQKTSRWLTNLTLMTLNTIIVRLAFPAAAVGIALIADQANLGLFNLIELPHALAFVASVILLDLFIYFQHVLFHAVPALWRLHMVHHTDLDYDLTTGVRFHPVEILISMALKGLVIIALGAPVEAVLAFEILLNCCAMFNHGNIALPPAADKLLRLIFVTPDMHRIHHSTIKIETNSNYGFNLSLWDKLFGTYKNTSQQDQATMDIGLEHYRDPSQLTLTKLLLLPTQGKTGPYPINKN